MKIKKFIILLAIILVFFITNVKADTIYSIDMNVFINEGAIAEITEV